MKGKVLFTIVLSIMVGWLGALELAEIKLGVSGGYNLAQHYGNKDQAEGYKIDTGFHHGFTSGLYLELPIVEDFAFRYEFNYVTRGSEEDITISELDGEELYKPAVMNVYYHLGYMEFPMLFKYTTLKSDKLSLAINAGAAMALKTNGRYELDGVVYFPVADSFTTFPIREMSHLKEVNQFDFSLIYGGELDFQMLQRPFTLGYRFTIGWDYLNLPTYALAEQSTVSLRNQSYALYLSTPLWHYKRQGAE